MDEMAGYNLSLANVDYWNIQNGGYGMVQSAQEQQMIQQSQRTGRAGSVAGESVDVGGDSPNMSTLSRGLNRHPHHYMGPADKPHQPQRAESDLGGVRDGRGRYLSDSTLYRNTIVHGHPTEKDFQPSGPWGAEYAYKGNGTKTPTSNAGRATPLSPEKVADAFHQMHQAARAEEAVVTASEGKTLVELDPAKLPPQHMPPPQQTQRAPPQLSLHQPMQTSQQQRVPSRASSVYSGISSYAQQPRRMTEGHIHPQPMFFQPIPQQWQPGPGMVWQPAAQGGGHHQPPQHYFGAQTPQPQQTAERGQAAEEGRRGQPRSLSRSASEMGVGQRSAFVAATLPRKMPSVQVVNGGAPTMRGAPNGQAPPMPGGLRQPTHTGTLQRPPSSLMGRAPPSSVEFRHEFNPAEFPRKKEDGRKEEEEKKSNSEGYGSDAADGPKTGSPAASEDRIVKKKDSKPSEEERFLVKMRAAEERRRELANWDGVTRLSYAHLLLSALIFALGIARLVKMSVWGLGVELVWGVLVFVCGVLGAAGGRKRNFCAVTAHSTLAAVLAGVAPLPFALALMATVPDSFSAAVPYRELFTNDNGLYGAEVVLGVAVVVEALLCVVSAALGCQMAGKALEIRQEELRAQPLPVLGDLRLAPPQPMPHLQPAKPQ